MKTFFATFAAILCAAAVIWGVWAAKESLEQRRAAERAAFANHATTAAKMRDVLTGYDSWDALKLSGPSDSMDVQWADVVVADAVLRRLKVSSSQDADIQASLRNYLRDWRAIVDEHKSRNPKWAEQLTKVLDEIEAEAARNR